MRLIHLKNIATCPFQDFVGGHRDPGRLVRLYDHLPQQAQERRVRVGVGEVVDLLLLVCQLVPQVPILDNQNAHFNDE